MHPAVECGADARALFSSENSALIRFCFCQTMNTPMITEQLVLDALRQVVDPELGCNIVDLGLIYNVEIAGAGVRVAMTLTTPGCPMHGSISQGAQTVLLGMEGVTDAEVEVVWDPPWHPSMMTEAGRIATSTANFSQKYNQ
jgi:metal-sulfur cluster biosynthetic enzyme